jgi:hypothetical protein
MIESERMRNAGHIARMAAKRHNYRLLLGEPEQQGPPRRPRYGWVDNIKIDLGERERE